MERGADGHADDVRRIGDRGSGQCRLGSRGPLSDSQRSGAPVTESLSLHASRCYDAIVIGGGHNGLVHAAYLARAGRSVLVVERRHVLGGAAVTEEVFPGFKFSVCSYVVSLLRPEIIRELDLPRHGLEILPLDGTFTPMPNGDYLWRVNDHAQDAPRNRAAFARRRRGLRRVRAARWSRWRAS